jgi:hypothetical protein
MDVMLGGTELAQVLLSKLFMAVGSRLRPPELSQIGKLLLMPLAGR